MGYAHAPLHVSTCYAGLVLGIGSSSQRAGTAAFTVACCVWIVWKLKTGVGSDGEAYLRAVRNMMLGLDPYLPGTDYIYPPFLAWAVLERRNPVRNEPGLSYDPSDGA